jgi:hypothetical protein
MREYGFQSGGSGIHLLPSRERRYFTDAKSSEFAPQQFQIGCVCLGEWPVAMADDDA